jgi:hypothetical protein
MFSGLREGLIFLLCLYPVGLVRLYFFFRTDKGKTLSFRLKISYLVVQFVLALSVLLYLLYGNKEAREPTPRLWYFRPSRRPTRFRRLAVESP